MGKLANAVKNNNRRETLVALREIICKKIEKTESGRDLAALSKRLMEIEAELEALPDPDAEDNPLVREQKRASRRGG